MLKLKVSNLGKRFGQRQVFSDINLELSAGQSVAVTGPNGSGKTTLIKTILGLIPATKGKTEIFESDQKLDFIDYRKMIALVSPYMNLYDNLTGKENLQFLSEVTGIAVSDEEIIEAFKRVGLAGREKDFAGAYSSGMKQRLKYALAIIRHPELIFLDEPTSNLDEPGKAIVFELIKEYRDKAIVVIATNETEEYTLAEERCQLDR